MEMNECVITGKFNCPHKEISGKLCSACTIPDQESELEPKQRTIGDVIQILSRFALDTPLCGASDDKFANLSTIQANCPDGKLDNVMMNFFTE